MQEFADKAFKCWNVTSPEILVREIPRHFLFWGEDRGFRGVCDDVKLTEISMELVHEVVFAKR